jgi:hypothetical protein
MLEAPAVSTPKEVPKDAPTPPSKGPGRWRVKVWHMLPSGKMQMQWLLDVSRGPFEGDLGRFLAEPSFSECVSSEMTQRGLLFQSVFKACINEKR